MRNREVSSLKFKSPWGLNKTRMRLRSQRFNRAMEHRTSLSPMSMRRFDDNMARFFSNWSTKSRRNRT